MIPYTGGWYNLLHEVMYMKFPIIIAAKNEEDRSQ